MVNPLQESILHHTLQQNLGNASVEIALRVLHCRLHNYIGSPTLYFSVWGSGYAGLGGFETMVPKQLLPLSQRLCKSIGPNTKCPT